MNRRTLTKLATALGFVMLPAELSTWAETLDFIERPLWARFRRLPVCPGVVQIPVKVISDSRTEGVSFADFWRQEAQALAVDIGRSFERMLATKRTCQP